MENYLLNICRSAASKFEYLKVQLIWVLKSTVIEKVSVKSDDDINKVFWEIEKYWQAQLFTLSHGLNNPNKRYALKRRHYGK